MDFTGGRIRLRPGGSRFKQAAGMGFVGALATVAAACGSSGSHVSSSGAAPTSGATTAPAQTAPKAAASVPSSTSTSVKLATSAQYGRYLTTASGFALYTYTADRPGGRGCTGECLKLWPPLLLGPGQSAAVAGAGVSGLGTFHRGSSLQVTFGGLPLYTFIDDKSPGEVKGQHYVDPNGTWFLAALSAPAASATTMPPATASPTTMPPATASPTTAPPTTAPPTTAPTTTAPSGGGASF